MLRPSPGQHENNIETDVSLAKGGMPRQPDLGRAMNPPTLGRRDRSFRIVTSAPPLDFNKCDTVTPHGNDIDLSRTCNNAPPDDAIAFGHQRQCRKKFTAMTSMVSPPALGFGLILPLHGVYVPCRPLSLRPMS